MVLLVLLGGYLLFDHAAQVDPAGAAVPATPAAAVQEVAEEEQALAEEGAGEEEHEEEHSAADLFADIGRRAGILSAETFSAILIMVIVTTFIAPPLLKVVFKPEEGGSADGAVPIHGVT